MSTPVTAKFSTALEGSTCQGQLSPARITLNLVDQDAHTQLTVVCEPGNAAKAVALPSAQGTAASAQTYFLLSTDENVQVRLNGVAELTYNITAGGFLGFSGQPEVSLVELTSIDDVNATVAISKVMGSDALPNPPGGGAGSPAGGLRLEDIGPAVASQTAFTLPSTPTNPAAAVLYVDGVQYSNPTFFTIAGVTLTWLDGPFAMAGAERVEVLYQ